MHGLLSYHTVDAKLVTRKLGHHLPITMSLPHSDTGHVTTLASDQEPAIIREAQTGQRLLGTVGDVGLAILPGIVQDHGASVRDNMKGKMRVFFPVTLAQTIVPRLSNLFRETNFGSQNCHKS